MITGFVLVPLMFILPPFKTAIYTSTPPLSALICVPAGIVSVTPSFTINEDLNW